MKYIGIGLILCSLLLIPRSIEAIMYITSDKVEQETVNGADIVGGFTTRIFLRGWNRDNPPISVTSFKKGYLMGDIFMSIFYISLGIYLIYKDKSNKNEFNNINMFPQDKNNNLLNGGIIKCSNCGHEYPSQGTKDNKCDECGYPLT